MPVATVVIALTLPAVGCAILDPAMHDAEKAATRATESTDDAYRTYSGACKNVKLREYGAAARGEYSGDDTLGC